MIVSIVFVVLMLVFAVWATLVLDALLTKVWMQRQTRQQRPYDWAKEPKTTEKLTWRSGNVIHVKGWHDEHEA